LFLSACSSTPQEKEALHMKRGQAAIDKKDYKTAVVEYKVASQNMPKDAEPLYQLGMTYVAVGAGKQAVEAFSRAVTLNPKHEGAQFQMAMVKVGSNEPQIVQEAKQVLTGYLAAHPGNLDAMGSLALAEAKLGNKEEAFKWLQTIAEKAPDDLHASSMVVALYAATGNVNAAKDLAHDLAERVPNSPAALTLRAQVSLATHDTADADAQISRALSLRRDFRPALELRLRRELMDRNSVSAEETTQELAKLPEKRTWSAYGRILFAEKKIDQAMAEFTRVLKEHDDNVDVRNEYSTLLTNAGRRKDAEAVIAGTLAKNPKDRSALLQRATLEVDKGDLDAAVKDVKTLQGMKINSPQLMYQQARIFGARGESVQQGDTLADLLKTSPRYLAARLDLARVMLASGKARNSVTLLEQASPAEKRTPEYVFYHNMALMAAGDWDQAGKDVAAALAALRSPGFLYQDALVKTQKRDLAGARKSLEAAFQMEPGNSLTLTLLGDIMRQQGDGAKFLAMVKDAAAKHPESAVLENVLGRQLAGQGDAAGAKAAFEAARAAGDQANAEIELAALDVRAGAIDKARQRLLDLTKTHDNARARLMLAEIETRKGASADVVIAHYLKALELEPSNAAAMNNLADVLASRKSKYDDALFWAQKALATSPNSPVVEDTIGWIYYREGKYDAALPYLEKSAKAMDRPVAHYHLAGALAKSGDPVRGRKEYETALKEDPKSDARGAVGSLFGDAGKK
jgi:tetratricopeptide (TPR) repeat protein